MQVNEKNIQPYSNFLISYLLSPTIRKKVYDLFFLKQNVFFTWKASHGKIKSIAGYFNSSMTCWIITIKMLQCKKIYIHLDWGEKEVIFGSSVTLSHQQNCHALCLFMYSVHVCHARRLRAWHPTIFAPSILCSKIALKWV